MKYRGVIYMEFFPMTKRPKTVQVTDAQGPPVKIRTATAKEILLDPNLFPATFHFRISMSQTQCVSQCCMTTWRPSWNK